MRQHYPRKPSQPGKRGDYQRITRHELISSRMNGSQNTRTIHTQQGTFVEYVPDDSPGGEGGATIQRFRITNISNNDYLVCRTWDGTTLGSTDVNVAKPLILRRNPFHNRTMSGVTYVYATGNPQKRTLTHTNQTPATATSDEYVTPPYAVNDEILAVEPEGGPTTGQFASLLSGATWEDINHHGRVWLPPYTVLDVCVNGETKRMVFRAGPNSF